MKSTIGSVFIAIACVFTLSCTNRTAKVDKKNEISGTEVPAVVKSTFEEKYPKATQVIWEKAHEDFEDTYKAKFKSDGQFWKAEFKKDGTLIKAKEDID